MIGIGLILSLVGYAVIYWGIEAIQGKQQDDFLSYIFPFTKKDIGKTGIVKPPPGARGPVGTPGPQPPTGALGPVGKPQ